MDPLLLAPIALSLWLLYTAVRGPRRYHQTVTSQVRPGAPEPTEEGYLTLGVRWWVASVLAIVITGWAVWDDVAVSDGELFDAVSRASTLTPNDEVGLTVLLVRAELELDTELAYEEVATEESGATVFEVYREVLGVRTGEVCLSITDRSPGDPVSSTSVVVGTDTDCAP